MKKLIFAIALIPFGVSAKNLSISCNDQLAAYRANTFSGSFDLVSDRNSEKSDQYAVRGRLNVQLKAQLEKEFLTQEVAGTLQILKAGELMVNEAQYVTLSSADGQLFGSLLLGAPTGSVTSRLRIDEKEYFSHCLQVK